MLQTIYQCSMCNGIGHTERWAQKRIKNKFMNMMVNLFRISSCEYCIGTGINMHKMSNSILHKPLW